MDLALGEEQAAKKLQKAVKLEEAPSKHVMEAESSADGAKRAKLEIQSSIAQGKGGEVDVSLLPAEAVIEMVMTGLAAASIEHIRWAFEVSEAASTTSNVRMHDERWSRMLQTQYRFSRYL